LSRVILAGKAASGKDYMRKVLESRGFKYGVSYTTRQPRKNEVEGKDYFFLTKERFLELAELDYWYEYIEFNGWYYGTSKEQFHDTCNLFIMTPHGISMIREEDRANTTIFYVDIPHAVRVERLSERDMPGDTTTRRIEADEADFKTFTDFDIRITNPNF
jgi:guanylate kinase